MENFEEQLAQMTKPDVSHLKHQDLLASAIIEAKDNSAISWWWLSIPLYLIATFIMKTIFIPHTSLPQNIREFTSKEVYLSVLLFLILPVVFIVINICSLRNIHFLLGNPMSIKFLLKAWFNVLMIIFSILIIIMYSL